MRIVSISFEISRDGLKAVEEMMRETGISSRTDLFNHALTLWEYAVSQAKAGRIFGSVDLEAGTWRDSGNQVLRDLYAEPRLYRWQ